MNSTQIQTTLAPIVGFFAGLLAGKGLFGLDATAWAQIIGGVVGFVATVWGIFATRNNAVIAQAAALPEVKTIVATPATAAAIPSADVVSSDTNKVVAK